MLIRFEMYPITGQSDVLKRNGYLKIGIVRGKQGRYDDRVPCCKILMCERIIWMKLCSVLLPPGHKYYLS